MASPGKEIPLIQALKRGDKQSLYQLYDMYSGSLYGVILRICRDEAEAQDVLQETFIAIWQKISLYDASKGKFYTWAYRIAKNLSLNKLRNKREFIQIENSGVYKREVEEMPDYSLLKGVLTTLEAHHQEAIRLVYFNGYTHAEAHKHMKVPLGTFKSYIRQALKKLREGYPGLLLLGSLLYEIVYYG